MPVQELLLKIFLTLMVVGGTGVVLMLIYTWWR
jgi:hypothetical protein